MSSPSTMPWFLGSLFFFLLVAVILIIVGIGFVVVVIITVVRILVLIGRFVRRNVEFGQRFFTRHSLFRQPIEFAYLLTHTHEN